MTQTITAENVLTLFPDVDTSLARSVFPTSAAGSSARDSGELEGYDEEQIRLMDEVCIVLDENDKPIGSATKKTCKLVLLFSTLPLYRGKITRGYPSLLRGESNDVRAFEKKKRLTIMFLRRPSYDEYQPGSPAPSVLCLPLRLAEASAPPAACH